MKLAIAYDKQIFSRLIVPLKTLMKLTPVLLNFVAKLDVEMWCSIFKPELNAKVCISGAVNNYNLTTVGYKVSWPTQRYPCKIYHESEQSSSLVVRSLTAYLQTA